MPYTIQGQAADIDEPQIQNDRTYVQLRELVQHLGGSLSWDNDEKVATATIGPWKAIVTADDTSVDVSGTAVTLQAPPFVDDDGRVWVRASFFHDTFGYNVQINGDDINIVNPAVQ